MTSFSYMAAHTNYFRRQTGGVILLRISKIIKLSRCKYMKMLPGFLPNSAEEKMSDTYVKHQAKFSIKPPKSHLWRAPRREHYIVFIRYNITTRAHIVLILHYIESGIMICSKKLYTVYSTLLCLEHKINTSRDINA